MLYRTYLKYKEKKGENDLTIAKNSHINSQTLSQWKTGKVKNPEMRIQEKLAEYLGIPKKELWEYATERTIER